MRQSLPISPKSVTWVLLLIAVLLTLSGLVSAYGSVEIKRYFVLRVLFRLFYLNEEANLPAWFSSLQWLFAAVLALLIGARGRRHEQPYANHWIILGVIFFFLSTDEATAIHESIGVFVEHVYPTSGYLSYGWVLFGIPFVAVFVLAFTRFLLHLPLRIRALFVLAGAIYVFGALGLEMLAAAREKALSKMGYQVVVAAEEFSEMLGVVLLIYALLSHIDSLAGGIVIEIRAAKDAEPRVAPRLPSSAAGFAKRYRWLILGLGTGVSVLVVGGIVALVLSGRPPAPAGPDARTAESQEAPFVDRTIAGELGPGDRRLRQDGSYVDVHVFHVAGNSAVTIRMESTDFDPYLAVRGPDGTKVTHDASPQRGKSRVEFATSTGGSYRVLANAYHDGVGSYRLYLTTRELTPRPMRPSPGPHSAPEPNPSPRLK